MAQLVSFIAFAAASTCILIWTVIFIRSAEMPGLLPQDVAMNLTIKHTHGSHNPQERFNNWTGLWGTFLQKSKSEMPVHLNKFYPALSVEYLELTLDILDTFAKTLEHHGIRYFLYSGTLIGSLRHHAPIMWDDDIDLGVFYSDRDHIREILQPLEPDYILYSPPKLTAWKFYSKLSKKTRNLNAHWNWPYLDIFFMRMEDEEVRDLSWPYTRWAFPYKYIFPLIKRPFGWLDLYAPRCPAEYLKIKYNITDCVSRDFSHEHELKIMGPTVSVSCSDLEPFYPFVTREHEKNVTIETLLLNGHVLQQVRTEKCPEQIDTIS